MSIRVLSFFLLFFMVLFFASCADDPSDIGLNLLGQDQLTITLLNSQDTPVPQTSYFFRRIIPMGTASRFLLGNHNGYQASSLLKFFFNLRDTVKTDLKDGKITIVSAELLLTPVYQFGTDTSAVFNTSAVNGYVITEPWANDSVAVNKMPSYTTAADILTQKPAPDSLVRFSIDTAVVRNWMMAMVDTANYSNNGFILRAEGNTNEINGFQAYTSSGNDLPILQVRLVKAGTYDTTLSYFTLADAYVVSGPVPASTSEKLFVQSGLTINSRITFDVTQVPDNAVINRAELILTRDSLLTKIGASGLEGMTALFVESVENDTVVTANTSYYSSLRRSGNIYSADVTTIVTQWYERKLNLGILLIPSASLDGLELYAIEGAAAPIEKRPRLVITYTSKQK